MENDTAEVWLELETRRHSSDNSVLFGEFYRELAEVRGAKSRPGSGLAREQKERLYKWSEKVLEKVLIEDKITIIGGDFNAEIGGQGREQDPYGGILEDYLICEGGLKMLIKEGTHQGIRRGEHCQLRCLDHIYSNRPDKMQNTRVIKEMGSHHSLTVTTLRENTKLKGPTQHRACIRKNYTKERYIQELDKCKWE